MLFTHITSIYASFVVMHNIEV